MNTSEKDTSLWTDEQEKKIEKACEHALMCLHSWGPMHLTTLISVLDKQGFNDQVSGREGTAVRSGLAVWRLCKEKRIRCISKKTVMVKSEIMPIQNHITRQVFLALRNFGGIATQDNLIAVMAIEGFGEQTVRDSIRELLDAKIIKHPFILSPNRRVWTPNR